MKLKKALILLAVCVLSLTAFACGTDSGSSTPDPEPQVVEIVLSDSEVTLITGQSKTITATVTGSDEAPEWLTSNSNVATVEGGEITAVSEGEADISAKIGEVSAVCKVTVKNPVTITVDKDKLTLNATTWTDSQSTVFGKTSEKITAALQVNGEPATAEIAYKSLNEQIATVSADGTVTGVKIGTANIEASAVYNGETYKATVNVTVKKVDVDSIEAFTFGGDKNEWVIDVARFGLTADDVIAIYYKESGDDFVQIDQETGEIIYDGNNAKVITDGIDIDSKEKPDEVVIETEDLLITIRIAYVTAKNVEFVSEASPMLIGDSKHFKLYAFGVEVSESAEWSVNKSYIANISNDGVITAVNYGTAVITAKVYGYTYTTTQVVLKEKEIPAENSVKKEVHNYASGADLKGWMVVTHGEFAIGDWISFTFTPEVDLPGHQVFVYYGLNNCMPEDRDKSYPNGVAFAIAGTKKTSANMFDDSSFVVLDSQGNKLGSIAKGTGAGTFKAGETYKVFVKIPDDGSVDHDIYIKFSSETHLVQDQVYLGVVAWRDHLDNLNPEIYPQDVKGYAYNGETKGETVNLDKTLTFKASEFATKNTIDLAELGIEGEVIGANVIGARGEFIVKNASGVPVVENGKLTLVNNFLTKAGTQGVKTFEIELDEKKYVLKLEVIAADEKASDAVVLMQGEADKVFVGAQKMVSDIQAGKTLFAFDYYASGISGSEYLYLQVGARHIHLKADQAWIHSTWDTSRNEYITADFIKVFDAEGNLVTDTVSWAGSKMFGSTQNSMQAGKWYKVFINMEGRAWGDDICLNPSYASVAGVMAKTVNSNAYIANAITCSPAELAGISIKQSEISIPDDGEQALIVSLSSVMQGATVTYKSSNEQVATVTADGVVKAHKAGVAIITATAMGKEATCVVNVLANLAAQEGTKTKLTTAIGSWLPGTFDVGAAGSNTNVNPAYIPGEDFGDFNMLEVDVTFKADAPAGYLHIYEYQGRKSDVWPPITKTSAVIGKDAYVAGTKDGAISPTAAFNDLRIYDLTDGNKEYRESAIEWKAGHTYKILIALHGDNSIGFWYTSSLLYTKDGYTNGVYSYWNMPDYALDVLSVISFGDFYGAYKVAGSDITLDAEDNVVRVESTLQLNATVSGIADKTITFTSSNNDVATVSESGLVTGIATGTVVITATNAEGKSASKELTVKAKSDEVEVSLRVNNVQFEKKFVKKGEVLSAPVAPEFIGYNFSGWFNGEELFDFSAALDKDVTLNAKYELAGETSTLGDATKYTATPVHYIIRGGNDIVANHAAGKDYLTFKFRTYTEMTETDILYLQVGARHIAIGKDNTAFVAYWDVTRRDAIPADAVCIYDENGTLVRDAVLWSANGNVNNGSIEEGSVTGSLEVGKTYTVVINVECRAWDDAFMNMSFDAPGGIVAGLDAAGILVNACGGLYTTFEYVGISAKNA